MQSTGAPRGTTCPARRYPAQRCRSSVLQFFTGSRPTSRRDYACPFNLVLGLTGSSPGWGCVGADRALDAGYRRGAASAGRRLVRRIDTGGPTQRGLRRRPGRCAWRSRGDVVLIEGGREHPLPGKRAASPPRRPPTSCAHLGSVVFAGVTSTAAAGLSLAGALRVLLRLARHRRRAVVPAHSVVQVRVVCVRGVKLGSTTT